MALPSKITAGATFEYVVSFSDYPSGSCTAKLLLTDGTNEIEVDATAEPDDSFTFREEAAQTTAWTVAEYSYSIVVTCGSDVTVAASGNTEVVALNNQNPNALQIATANLKSAESELQERITGSPVEYSIQGGLGNRSLKRMTTEELMKAISYWRSRVNQLKNRELKGRSQFLYARIR